MTLSDWFVATGAASTSAARIFCFAHAGGNPRLFLDWQPYLGAEVEIVAVCPPGRGHRLTESCPSIDDLIEGAAAAIAVATQADERPSYLFGHSLGGLIAFEVARRLRDRPTLRHLIASAISAPSLLPSQRVRELAKLEGHAFARELTFFGGLPREVLADEGVLELLLPCLIADFRMAVGYRYRPAAPLAIDVTLIAGRQDPHLGPAQLRPWREECRNPPACHWVDGGHFYFDTQPSAVTDVLRDIIRADQHVEVI